MHYATSDIHGNFDRYQALLDRLCLVEDDVLYILGNVLGRGPQGLRILHDVSGRDNVVCLLGRQEFAAMIVLPWLQEELSLDGTRDEVLAARMQQVMTWKESGGAETMDEFAALPSIDRAISLAELNELPLYAETEAAGKSFVLVHAGLDRFSPRRPLKDYSVDELVLHPPNTDKTYFEKKYLVFGHTPTPFLFAQGTDVPPREFPARIFRRDKLIGVDCGSVYGGPLGCICLETFDEYYITD